VLRKLPEVQREFIRTQHLHAVASSIAKLRVDAFVSAATAEACSMAYLVRLFMKPHLLALLQENCHDFLRCVFLRKLSGCARNITAFCQHLLTPIKSAILADTDISVKPKYWPIYRSISSICFFLLCVYCFLIKVMFSKNWAATIPWRTIMNICLCETALRQKSFALQENRYTAVFQGDNQSAN